MNWEFKTVDLKNESTDPLHPISVEQAKEGVAKDLNRRLGDGWKCISTEACLRETGDVDVARFVFRRKAPLRDS
jgi:hypothetical protein